MSLSPWFAANDTPVNPGRYECELVSGAKRMLEWDGIWEINESEIERWRGVVRQCKKCIGYMVAGKAIAQTWTGLPDFPGDKCCVTLSPGGSGKLIDCAKCVLCGWSVTV